MPSRAAPRAASTPVIRLRTAAPDVRADVVVVADVVGTGDVCGGVVAEVAHDVPVAEARARPGPARADGVVASSSAPSSAPALAHGGPDRGVSGAPDMSTSVPAAPAPPPGGDVEARCCQQEVSMICHLVGQADWAAGADGYRPASLAAEGFVHFSTPTQALATANRYYRGRTDLLLLVVDPTRLSSPLRYEPPAPPSAAPAPSAATAVPTAPGPAPAATAGQLFPHLYGPIDAAAVVAAHPFPADPDGGFSQLPADV
jgi:uncharacterized protein (DUF952 family)